MPHRETSLAIKPSIKHQSQIKGADLPTCFIITGNDYSLAVNSIELLYQLTLFIYLMLQVNMN